MNTNKITRERLVQTEPNERCVAMLLAKRQKGGGRQFEILFDEKGEVLRPIAFLERGVRFQRSYAVLVSPYEVYYRLYLRLTDPRHGMQNKFGRLEIVTYEAMIPFKDFCNSLDCPYLLEDYWLCGSIIHGVVWRLNPRGSWAIPSAIVKAPSSVVRFLTDFEYGVKTTEDLENLVKFI